MKFQVDDKETCSLSDMQERVMFYSINEKQFHSCMCQKVNWVVNSSYQGALDQLLKDWMPKMIERYDSLPTNQEKLLDMIFSQKDYEPKS